MFKLTGAGFLAGAAAKTGEAQIMVEQNTSMKRIEHLL
jgi:hypothetical protein